MKVIEKIKIKTTVLMIVVFLAGFGIGTYITLYSEKQLSAVGASAYVIAGFSALGTVLTIVNRIQDWQKDKNKPTLQFNSISCRLESGNKKDYFLRVSMVKGDGEAINCHAYLSIEGVKHQTLTSGWPSNNFQYTNIGSDDELRFFRLSEGTLTFFNMPLHKGGIPYSSTYPYNDIINRNLKVKVVAENTNVPSPYIKKISQIIQEGDKSAF